MRQAVLDVHAAYPTAKLLFAGYSQGSMVVHEYLNEFANGTASPNGAQIIRAAMLADPDRVKHSQVLEFGDVKDSSYGICDLISPFVSCPLPPDKLADVTPIVATAILSKMTELSKKKQDGVVNTLKIKMINRLLTELPKVLERDHSFGFVNMLDEETRPQNSDVVLVLSQWRAALRPVQEQALGVRLRRPYEPLVHRGQPRTAGY